jgi:hypothetical protein
MSFLVDITLVGLCIATLCGGVPAAATIAYTTLGLSVVRCIGWACATRAARESRTLYFLLTAAVIAASALAILGLIGIITSSAMMWGILGTAAGSTLLSFIAPCIYLGQTETCCLLNSPPAII